MTRQRHLIAIASTTLLLSGVATAQTQTTATPSMTAATPMASTPRASSRDRRAAMQGEEEQLEQKLQAGKNRAGYKQIIESNGYRIAALNADDKDYLEYEVVKGENSYEVQLDFDDGATKASKIDVAANMWRAKATERMMKDADYRHTGALVVEKDGRSSDRTYMKSWTGDKDRLEMALPPKLKVADYKGKIEKLGYKVTALNDRENDYVEYEIAKGDNSYEVQIDVDLKTGMSTKVDVTSNLWEADATDRTTDNAGQQKAGKR